MNFFSPCSEEYTRETFHRRRQTREIIRGDPLSPKTSCLGRNQKVFDNVCDSWYLQEHPYSKPCNERDIRGLTNKVLQNSKCDVFIIVESPSFFFIFYVFPCKLRCKFRSLYDLWNMGREMCLIHELNGCNSLTAVKKNTKFHPFSYLFLYCIFLGIVLM